MEHPKASGSIPATRSGHGSTIMEGKMCANLHQGLFDGANRQQKVLNPKVDTPLFAATVPLQLCHVDLVHQPWDQTGSRRYREHHFDVAASTSPHANRAVKSWVGSVLFNDTGSQNKDIKGDVRVLLHACMHTDATVQMYTWIFTMFIIVQYTK